MAFPAVMSASTSPVVQASLAHQDHRLHWMNMRFEFFSFFQAYPSHGHVVIVRQKVEQVRLLHKIFDMPEPVFDPIHFDSVI
ncbi:hypothetical protein BTN49_3193 [Candidatus Enterovibrio escicola]|uniref:Uncharacterized protein n=1 Tax=Candidatus Enterovibrio escicola TaxID=1927127 RepID=A0A2A5SZF7_9GAMM|nr:hypothetical protein BTN49_3193 [Candidatus Enterovibrio escacola]